VILGEEEKVFGQDAQELQDGKKKLNRRKQETRIARAKARSGKEGRIFRQDEQD
jgi:hypothetical protein